MPSSVCRDVVAHRTSRSASSLNIYKKTEQDVRYDSIYESPTPHLDDGKRLNFLALDIIFFLGFVDVWKLCCCWKLSKILGWKVVLIFFFVVLSDSKFFYKNASRAICVVKKYLVMEILNREFEYFERRETNKSCFCIFSGF